jgi:hypothetical protein
VHRAARLVTLLASPRGFASWGPLVALAAALPACERGCLKSCLEERGATADAMSPMPLHAVDCSDGLARCVEGRIETSRAFSYPSPCSGAQCACPWDRVSTCPRGCVVDDVEVAMTPARAVVQLCAPDPAIVFSRPAPADAGVVVRCDGERFHCSGGIVVACARAPEPVAVCDRGCADDGAALDDETVTLSAAIAILCAR